MLKKFNPVTDPNKDNLICYFQDELKLFIRAKHTKRGQDLNT